MFSSKMFLPQENLKDYIKVFWFLEGRGDGHNFYTRNILPDGCATIVLVLNGTMNLSIYENGTIKNGIYIIPPVVHNHYDLISDDIYLIDIQLNPAIFYKLFNIPIDKLENKIYTFKDLSLNFDHSILEKVYEVKRNKNLVYSLLNDFFNNLFYKLNFKPDEITTNINKLYYDGILDNFFKEQNLSVRQLERKVKAYTGLTPKNISRMGRFYSVLEYMKFRQFSIEFCELALEHNFSDQSHFIKEFKFFTESTPKDFIKNLNNFPQYTGLCNITKIIDS